MTSNPSLADPLSSRAIWAGGTPAAFARLRRFLQVELAPFPGRMEGTLRLVLAVSVALIFSMAVRVPSAAISVYLIFFLFQEDSASTTKLALAAMVALTFCVGILLLVTKCFVDANWFRVPAVFLLLWGSFYLTRILVMGVVGRLFACVLAMYLMTADAIQRAEPLTRTVMYMWPIVAVGVGAAVLVDWLWKREVADAIQRENRSRLATVSGWLQAMAGRPAEGTIAVSASRLRASALGGSIRWQKLLNRLETQASSDLTERSRLRAVSLAVDDLVATAAVTALSSPPVMTPENRADFLGLAADLDELAGVDGAKQMSTAAHIRQEMSARFNDPTSDEITRVFAALCDAAAGRIATPSLATTKRLGEPHPGPFVSDAFTNPEHWQFAIKATLAVGICYAAIVSVDWLGTRTALFTCIVAALTTVGASTQKQALRFAGLIFGGLLGIGVVVFVMPHLDSIASLVVVLAAVTAMAGWISTGSQRISYAGFQLALAFYLTVLQGFGPSTDLAAIRDRAAGIVIGIIVISLVFRYLWPVHARELLNRDLPSALGDLAKFAGHAPPRGNGPALTAQFVQIEQLLEESALEPDRSIKSVPRLETQRQIARNAEIAFLILRGSPDSASSEAEEIEFLSRFTKRSPPSGPLSETDVRDLDESSRRVSALPNTVLGRAIRTLHASVVQGTEQRISEPSVAPA